MASFSTSSINSLKKVSMMVSMGSEPSWNVVEHSGLVASSFQFFTRLAAVFAEEVGNSGVVGFISSVKRCLSFVWTTTHQLRIHIRTCGY